MKGDQEITFEHPSNDVMKEWEKRFIRLHHRCIEVLGGVGIRGLRPIPRMGYRIGFGLGTGRLCRIETEFGDECRRGKLRGKGGVGLREGGGGRCKWGEVMGDRLGRGGGRNCAQDLREGRNEWIMLGKVPIEIHCKFGQPDNLRQINGR